MFRNFTQATLKVTLTVVAACCNPALAESPSNTIAFYLHESDGHLSAPVASVALSDKRFTTEVEATIGISGNHEISVTLYDPTGQQILKSTREGHFNIPSDGLTVSYRFNADDPVGKWRVIATLDGAPFADRWLTVTRSHQN